MSDVLHYRGKQAALTRSRSADDPELLDAKRDLRAAKLEAEIRRTVDAAPQLSAIQRQRLAALLTGPAA